MNPENDRAPDAANTRGNSGRTGTPTITRRPDFPRLPRLGCPAGCPPDMHTCGVGEPVAELVPAGPYERAGLDMDIPTRDYYGRLRLERERAS